MSDINYWTPSEIRTLVEMWNAGKSTDEIGKKLNRTARSVIGKARRQNLPVHSNTVSAYIRANGRSGASG